MVLMLPELIGRNVIRPAYSIFGKQCIDGSVCEALRQHSAEPEDLDVILVLRVKFLEIVETVETADDHRVRQPGYLAMPVEEPFARIFVVIREIVGIEIDEPVDLITDVGIGVVTGKHRENIVDLIRRDVVVENTFPEEAVGDRIDDSPGVEARIPVLIHRIIGDMRIADGGNLVERHLLGIEDHQVRALRIIEQHEAADDAKDIIEDARIRFVVEDEIKSYSLSLTHFT